jgi:cell division protein FtsQ
MANIMPPRQHYRQPAPRGAAARMQPRPSRGKWVSVTRMLVLTLAFGITGVVGFGVHAAVKKVNSQKVAMVHIENALTFVTEQQIKDTVSKYVTASLISVDLDALKRELEALPWIREAVVRRQWPDALTIHVEEEIAIARWGKAQLLNQQGQVFQPDSIEEQMQLPLLAGPVDSERKVMRQYQEFNQLLYPLGVRIRDLTLSDSGSYELTLINGVRVKLGREEELERLRRLVVFLESEHGRDLQNVDSIDLRYRNGLAVARSAEISSDEVAPATGKQEAIVAR